MAQVPSPHLSNVGDESDASVPAALSAPSPTCSVALNQELPITQLHIYPQGEGAGWIFWGAQLCPSSTLENSHG